MYESDLLLSIIYPALDRVILNLFSKDKDISSFSENMINSDEISVLRYKMNVAFMISKLCDKKQLTLLPLNEFLKKNQEYHFDKKLFSTLEKNGINKDNFFNYKIIPFIKDELEKVYNIFSSLSVQKLI